MLTASKQSGFRRGIPTRTISCYIVLGIVLTGCRAYPDTVIRSGPLEGCPVPPPSVAAEHIVQVNGKVQNLGKLSSSGGQAELQTTFKQSVTELSEINPELTKIYALTVLCAITRSNLDQRQFNMVFDSLNQVMKEKVGPAFDVTVTAEWIENRLAIASTKTGKREKLVQIRNELSDLISTVSVRTGLDVSHLRSNIFAIGINGNLRMPHGLYYNMATTEELDIQLPMGVGCTGDAMTTGKWVAAFREEAKAGSDAFYVHEGEASYHELTIPIVEKGKYKVHESLTWLSCWPVYHNAKPVAVLVLDCIETAQCLTESERKILGCMDESAKCPFELKNDSHRQLEARLGKALITKLKTVEKDLENKARIISLLFELGQA